MVVQIDNPENNWLHGKPPSNINLSPPDKLPRKIVYSPLVADEEFNQMIRDLRAERQRTKPKRTLEIPWLIKAIGLLGGIGILAFLIKKGVTKIFKR